MTREEAIEQLQNCKGLIKQDGKDWLDERDIPLLDMAIEALHREEAEEKGYCHRITNMEGRGFVSVVRCKDCRHRYWDKTSEFWTCYHTMDLAFEDNDFCSLAERKEE